MSKITIPEEALEKAARSAYNKWRDKIRLEERNTMDADMLDEVAPEWGDLGASQQDWIEQARAACLAMLRTWPGMSVAPIPRFRPYKEAETLQHIILPLTKETET